ncbi:hypothetical protein B0I35DRAFT_480568 [Stachybotrys elegans]|uniref:Uncharacterized protein n=1 Tax=Stachybotrys elegans TaxID=80388 RepID=A0A8K0SJM8_9HYPO|nr:hypothetical protein B0I35DRAFT_480568 [Stachybotrys elegans]
MKFAVFFSMVCLASSGAIEDRGEQAPDSRSVGDVEERADPCTAGGCYKTINPELQNLVNSKELCVKAIEGYIAKTGYTPCGSQAAYTEACTCVGQQPAPQPSTNECGKTDCYKFIFPQLQRKIQTASACQKVADAYVSDKNNYVPPYCTSKAISAACNCVGRRKKRSAAKSSYDPAKFDYSCGRKDWPCGASQPSCCRGLSCKKFDGGYYSYSLCK